MVFWFKPQQIKGAENYLLTFLLYPAIVVLAQHKWAQKLFSNKIWGEIGAVSYGLYVWHIPLILIYFTVIDYFKITVDFANVVYIGAFLAVSCAVAAISYYFIEKPVSKLINRFMLRIKAADTVQYN